MKLGNKAYLLIILFFGFKSIFAEEKITTSPLLNLDKIKPSFEELEDENENYSSKQNLKVKKENSQLKSSQAIFDWP